MQLTDSICDYWDSRSSGFSDAVVDEMRERGDDVACWVAGITGIHSGRVLDLGCGPGFFSIPLESAGYDVVGIDYSSEMVARATENAADAGVQPVFLRMDAQSMSFPNESFDMVVSRDVLWTLEHPEKAYSEILRILKPNGKALISDGNYYLHLYDPEYSQPKRMDDADNKHMRFNKDNVDFGIIEKLASDLPLSKVHRPQWDVDTVSNLGGSAEVISSKGEGSIVRRFVILVSKEVSG